MPWLGDQKEGSVISVTITWPLAFDSSSVLFGASTVTAPSTRLSAPALRRQEDLPRAGLRIPLGVTKQGRGAVVTGDVQDQKIIDTSLGSNDNQNAFQQDRGLGDDMIFDVSDAAVRGVIRIRLRDVFADFEIQHRYRLLTDTIVWAQDSEKQELSLEFKYHNLETDDTKDFEKGFRQGV